MKKLVLHIGMAKTGTSTIQETLGQGADQLRDQGIFYAPWKPFNHSFTFTVLFLGQPEKSFYYKQLAPISDEDWAQELRRLADQWKAFFSAADKGSWVVSAENLGRLAEDELLALRAFVEPYFDEIKVVAYVREPLRALKSKWEQDVKELRQPVEPQALLARTKKQMTYRYFRRWIDTFGRDNFVLRRFDPASFEGGNLLSDFLKAAELEINAELTPPEKESNQSLGVEGVSLLLALNSRYPLYRDGQYNEERGLARRQHLFYRTMRESGASPLSLDIKFNREEAERFNRRIAFLNSLLPEGEGFDEVEPSEGLTVLPAVDTVPADYAVELINRLSRLVDQMADRTDHLQAKVKALQAQLDSGK